MAPLILEGHCRTVPSLLSLKCNCGGSPRFPFETSTRSGISQGEMLSPHARSTNHIYVRGPLILTPQHITLYHDSSAASHERSKGMASLRSCITLFLSLMFSAGLAGCGPASSDNAPSLESRASGSGSTLSKQGQSRGNNSLTPVTQAASPIPLASVNGAGFASGLGTVQGGDSPQAVPAPSSEPGHPIEGLVVPDLMAQKLNSPNVRVRLRALEAWAREAPLGAVDPFILAFEDKDERVRARAQQLIEQDWARKAEAEKREKRDGR